MTVTTTITADKIGRGIRGGTNRAIVLDVLADRLGSPMTDEEIANASHVDHVSPRRSELRDMALVEDTGMKVGRMTRWRITKLGAEAAMHIRTHGHWDYA